MFIGKLTDICEELRSVPRPFLLPEYLTISYFPHCVDLSIDQKDKSSSAIAFPNWRFLVVATLLWATLPIPGAA
jgi:hypothetical protein